MKKVLGITSALVLGFVVSALFTSVPATADLPGVMYNVETQTSDPDVANYIQTGSDSFYYYHAQVQCESDDPDVVLPGKHILVDDRVSSPGYAMGYLVDSGRSGNKWSYVWRISDNSLTHYTAYVSATCADIG